MNEEIKPNQITIGKNSPILPLDSKTQDYINKSGEAAKSVASGEKAQDFKLQSISNERATKEAFPLVPPISPNNGFTPVETSRGVIRVRPIKLLDYHIFELVESPIHKLIMGDTTPDQMNKVSMAGVEAYSIVYQFTHPIMDVYQIASKGLESYKRAYIEMAADYTIEDGSRLLAAVFGKLSEANDAKVGYEGNESDDTKKKS